MRRRRMLFLTITVVTLLAAAGVLLRSQTKASPGVPNTPDSESIQATIREAYEIEAHAAHTFDTTKFASVFINDPRGGELSPGCLRLVQDVTGNTSNAAGYLDYKVAYYSFWERGALQLEELRAKADREGRALTQEEQMSLMDSSGRSAAPRSPERLGSQTEILFQSFIIDDDTATVVFDDGPRTNKMTLVRAEGKWYIAGNQVLRVHP